MSDNFNLFLFRVVSYLRLGLQKAGFDVPCFKIKIVKTLKRLLRRNKVNSWDSFRKTKKKSLYDFLYMGKHFFGCQITKEGMGLREGGGAVLGKKLLEDGGLGMRFLVVLTLFFRLPSRHMFNGRKLLYRIFKKTDDWFTHTQVYGKGSKTYFY